MQAFIRVKIDYDGTPHHILASQIATTACYHQRLEWILVLKDIFHVDINSLVDTRNGAPLLWGATKNGDAECGHFLLQYCRCDPDVMHEDASVIALACKYHMKRREEPAGTGTPFLTVDDRRRGQQLIGNTVYCSKLICIRVLLSFGVNIDRRRTRVSGRDPTQDVYPWCVIPIMSVVMGGSETLDAVRVMVRPEHDFRAFYATDRGRALCDTIVAGFIPLLHFNSYEDARSLLLADCFRKRAQAFLFCRWKKFDLLPCDITELLYDYVMIGDSRY